MSGGQKEGQGLARAGLSAVKEQSQHYRVQALSEALLRAGLGRQQGSTVAAEGTVRVESLSDPHSTDGNLLVLVCLPGLR